MEESGGGGIRGVGGFASGAHLPSKPSEKRSRFKSIDYYNRHVPNWKAGTWPEAIPQLCTHQL